jgi:hypothetical protein
VCVDSVVSCYQKISVDRHITIQSTLAMNDTLNIIPSKRQKLDREVDDFLHLIKDTREFMPLPDSEIGIEEKSEVLGR